MSIDTKQNIANAITSFSKGDLFHNSIQLFNSLGYKTERQNRLSKNTFKGFLEDFQFTLEKANFKKALSDDWKCIELLFQLTQTEMTRQSFLFDKMKIDDTIIEAYLFFAIELSGSDYTRTQLSDITRELNKVFPMPVMLLFKYDNNLTLSIIKRRLHKKDESKDVLEKVTLIKDISIESPHRAHIEILWDLSFDKLQSDFEFRNFVELHNAWQKTLDSSELNKRFYKELANWYFWAVDNVEFPDDVERNEEKRNSINVIRLLTRLIFVWFLKEKGNLIPDELFNKKKLDKILDYKDKTGSTYYKAILQNLFFATLNTEMNKDVPNNRAFVNRQYGIQEYYRYERFFKDKEAALKLFEGIPFLNGGLFENLDRNVGETNEQRIDCFSDNRKNEERLCVPDFLFFETEKEYDELNKIYDTTGRKYVVRGLLEVLNKYKFTIHENTPIEEEIALDPELLGKVFENLLASYNEETKTTARKLTGSFYTPREVVNYMVDESLIAYLKNILIEKRSDDVEEKLRDLFSYNENEPQFTEKEKNILVRAIDNCKIVDPACGSGAFPMGILHKIVFILGKLDPHNKRWMQRQIDKVYEIPDTTLHDNLKAEIEKAFTENFNDYGRKLYLIENCIYGVDIQPIAVQIAKLRFFISLIVDQKVNRTEKNLGIRPLPNLETKFVAANTLISIERPEQLTLRNDNIDKKEKQLHDVRERHFNARTPATKKKYRERDKQLRKELADLLEGDGFRPEATRLMASWDPYDQNKFAGFFDSEWMFGLQKGFDVIIGNPPYVSIQRMDDSSALRKANFETFVNTGDLYSLFYERGISLLKDNGILSYITSNKWINANYGKSTRKFFVTKTNPLILIDFAKVKIFESATVFVNILITQKARNKNMLQACSIEGDKLPEMELGEYFKLHKFELKDLGEEIWKVSNAGANKINDLILKKGIPLINWKDINFYRGITSGLNEAYHIDKEKRDYFIRSNKKSSQFIKPLLRGKDIKRWSYKYEGLYMLFIPWHFPLHENKGITNASPIAEKRFKTDYPELYEHLKEYKKMLSDRNQAETGVRYEWYALQRYGADFWTEFENPKIVWLEISDRANYAYDESGMFLTNSAYFMTGHHLKYILAVLNSKVADYYFFQITATIAGGRKRYTGQYVERVPVPQISEKEEAPFNKIVDYLLFLKSNENNQEARQACNFFESVLEAMVYELYFEKTVKESGYEILSHVKKLPPLYNNKQALEQVLRTYNDAYDKNNPIRNSVFFIGKIPIIKEIEDSFTKSKTVLNEN